MPDADLDLLFAAPLPAGRIAFLNADRHPALAGLADRLWCLQDWKPACDRLAAQGLRIGTPGEPVAAAFVRLGRQRQRNLGAIALAASLLAPGGSLRIAGANALGPARYAKDLAARGIGTSATSKGKARRLDAVPGRADFSDWRQAAAPRAILDGAYVSAPGVFAWDRIDAGSAKLAALLPTDLAGRVADLGAGFGFLSKSALEKAPGIAALDAFEADLLAVDCAKANLGMRAAVHWHDVTAGIGEKLYDAVFANPPFHDAIGEDRALGLRFLEVAAAALKPGGRFYLVANRHLPYEKALGTMFKRAERLFEDAAFKIYAASA